MRSRRQFLRCCQVLTLLALVAICGIAVRGQEAARPDRGTMPNRTYSVSDIENINLQNGNVSLAIPLAALPPIAGGKLSWTVSAHYNSKIWDVLRMQEEQPDLQWAPYVVDTPAAGGGWTIGGQYRIYFRNSQEDFTRVLYTENSGLPQWELDLLNNNTWWKVVLFMPDGSEHEFRPLGHASYWGSEDFLRGYFNVIPSGSPMRYYSVDGTYMFASISSMWDWTVYMPDGTQIIQTPDGIQRIQDTNGNKIKIFSDGNAAHYQDEQTGREIRVTYDPAANGGNGQSRVWYPTVGGAEHYIEVNYGTTTVQGKTYPVSDWDYGGEMVCQRTNALLTQLQIVREIIFPQTEPGQQRKFVFSYNSDTTENTTSVVNWSCNGYEDYTRSASVGWGELSRVITPPGTIETSAYADYSYRLNSEHSLQFSTDDLAYQSITQKKLYHDGTQDTWGYSIFDNMSSFTGPDGNWLSELRYCSSYGQPNCSTDKAGLAFRTTRPFMMTERHWTKLLFSGGDHIGPGGVISFNPVVDFEYTTLLDANNNPLKMSAKAFQYDYNGNVTQTTEYDWFDPNLVSRDVQGVPTGVPGSATVLRVTNSTHYNQASGSTSGNVYAKRSIPGATPLILNARQQTTTGPAIAQFSYDGNSYGVAPTVGNLTSRSVWDDVDNKWITTGSTYGLYGNLVTTTDGRGKVTTFGYLNPALGLPTSVTVDPQNGTGTQTTTTEYDYSTGLVTAGIDANGKRSEIDYTNHLLGAIDPFGRPGLIIGPDIGGGVNHQTRTFYEDNARTVTVLSDLNTEGDGLLKSQTISDMLGRAIESRQYENANDFIAVRKSFDPATRTQKISNPFRDGETVVWTTTTTDLAGRIISVTTPDNAAVTTSYFANFTTATDQAGKKRRSMTDALGRLIRVDEPDKDTGNLDDGNGLPIQPNTYDYDALGNLFHVYQGAQTRTFTYDSLSRLRTAQNPESGTITYTYDDNGNLLTKVDARSITSSYVYDSLNRVTSRSYSDGTPAVSYVYDTLAQNGKGRLTSVSSIVSSYNYAGYDAMGRVTGASQLIGAQTYTISGISYALAGHLKTMTYPSGHFVTYNYDSAGRLADKDAQNLAFTGNLGQGGSPRTYASGISYSSFGGLQEEKFGTQTPIYHKLRYNSRGQLWDMRASTVSFASDPANGDRGALVNYYSSNFVQGGSGPDNNGNLLRQENYIPGSDFFQDNFEYDKLNRLKYISEKLNGTGNPSFKQTYSCDRYGNRRINVTPSETFGGVNNLDFDLEESTNRLYALGDLGLAEPSRSMRYDAAGNLWKDTYTGAATGQQAIERLYDAENRMTKETQAGNGDAGIYSYDGDGRRVKRKVGPSETWQVYGIGGELIAEYAANDPHTSPQKEYGYRNGELLITATVTTGWGAPPSYTGPNPLLTGDQIKLENLTELRSAVNQLRQHAGLAPYNFTVDPNPQQNVTTVKADHIRQLRTALEEARTALGLSIGGYEHSTLTENFSLIYAVDFQELRGQVLSAWQSGGGVDIRWLVADQLGTPRMIFDQTGSLANVSRHDYLPFGEELYSGTGGRTTAQGYTASDNVRQKFTSKERDNETGLDYFLARYYSSTQGRFTSADPILITPDRQKLPQLLNLYSYVGNNPLVYLDPTGMERIRLGRSQADIQTEIDTVSDQLAQNAASTPEEHQALIARRQSLVTELEGTQLVTAYLAALNSIGEQQGLQLSDFTLSTDSANDFAGIPGLSADPLLGGAMGVMVGYSSEIFINTNSHDYQASLGHQTRYDSQGGAISTSDIIRYLGTAAVHERSHRDSPTRDLRLSEGRAYTEQLRVLQKFGVNAFKSSEFFYYAAGHVMNGSEGIFGW